MRRTEDRLNHTAQWTETMVFHGVYAKSRAIDWINEAHNGKGLAFHWKGKMYEYRCSSSTVSGDNAQHEAVAHREWRAVEVDKVS